MSLTIVLLLGLIAIIFALIFKLILKIRKNVAYFKKHGIPYAGNYISPIIRIITGQTTLVGLEVQFYKTATNTKGPFAGILDFTFDKNLVITDLDLVKSIFVKDFDHFVNRRPLSTQNSNKYFKKMLVAVESEEWKGIRSRISPCFTTSKLRRMLEIFRKSSFRMEAYLKEQMCYPGKKSMDVDFMQIFSKYAVDVIASCSFGVHSKSFEVKPEMKTSIEEMAQRLGFKFGGKTFLKLMLVLGAPKIADFFEVNAMDGESQEYFAEIVRQVLKRRESGERRDDFLQLMMDAQQGHSNQGSGAEETQGLDDGVIISNILQFINAGYDPTQSAMLFTLYAIALQPEVQRKLYNEVRTVIDKNGAEVTYDAISQMKYMDLVIKESLRFYPPATRTERACAKDYPVPGTNFVIEKGTIVLIPIRGIHHDPAYYPNPEVFDPERFSPENKSARHSYAFTPFGHGPRNCIGYRFAMITAKAVLSQLIYSFCFAPCSKTVVSPENGQQGRIPSILPKDSLWLNVTVRGSKILNRG